MTFEKALQLARTIRDDYPRLRFVALGRFLPPQQLNQEPEEFGISVQVDGQQRLTVIWSHDNLLPFSSPPERQPRRRERPKKPSSQTSEPLLF